MFRPHVTRDRERLIMKEFIKLFKMNNFDNKKVRVYYDIASTDIGTHDVNIEYLLLNT
jgi:hypothetical protein